MQLIKGFFFFFLIVRDNNGALWRRGTTYLMLWLNRHACFRAWFIVGMCFFLVLGVFIDQSKGCSNYPEPVECRIKFILGQNSTTKKSDSLSRLDA